MSENLIHMALARLWKFIHQVNAYFHAQEPWKLAKSDRDAFMQVLGVTCHSLRVIATLLWPIMPKKSEQLLASIGITFEIKDGHNGIEDLELSWKGRAFMLSKIAALFKKHEPKKKEEAPKTSTKKQVAADEYITIDDVIKVELLVGTIEQCEEIPKSDKLLKMQVNFGDKGVRQILAGIKASYAAVDLVGRQAIFVTNLKPRKMMGIESQGMMLISKDEAGKVHINSPVIKVPNGTRLH